MSRARLPLPCLSVLLLATACRPAPPTQLAPQPSAYAIVEGTAESSAPTDTVDEKASVGVARARWSLHDRPRYGAEFWQAIGVLDLNSANLGTRSVEERTFTAALKELLDGSPEVAAVGFQALHVSAKDSLVRLRSRIGLTMALSWYSDWPGLARISAVAADSESEETRAALAASVERWGRALGGLPPAQFDVPDHAIVLPMRRSAFGTPVISIRLNGHPYEFWLDTGASMTTVSDQILRPEKGDETMNMATATGITRVSRRRLAFSIAEFSSSHVCLLGHIDAALQIDVIVGQDFLRQFDSVTFDYARRRVIFEEKR